MFISNKNDVENISNNNTLTKMAILEHHDEARLCVTLMTCTQFVISIIALDFSFSDLLTIYLKIYIVIFYVLESIKYHCFNDIRIAYIDIAMFE